MPNSGNDFNTFFSGVIDINSTFARESRSESYLMAADNWDDAALQLNSLALTRAAILGRDCEVSYASVALWGAGRAAQCVLASPVPGGLGILWDDAAYLESDLNSNHPSTTLRIRQETFGRQNITRHLVGIPDGLINAAKYIGGVTPGVLDISGYDTVVTPSSLTLPTQTLWTYGDPIAGVTTHILWPAALKMYLKALHNFTWWGKLTAPSVATGANWKAMHYRGVGRVKMGRPILR